MVHLSARDKFKSARSLRALQEVRCSEALKNYVDFSSSELHNRDFPKPLLAGARIVDDVAILPTCVGLGLSGDPARVLSRHVAASLVRLCATLCPASQPDVFYSPGASAEKMSKEFIAAAVEEAAWPTVEKGKGKAFDLPQSEGGMKMSVILVDRAADLIGLCGHWGGSVAECAFAADEFPHLSGHTSDLAVNIPQIGRSEHMALVQHMSPDVFFPFRADQKQCYNFIVHLSMSWLQWNCLPREPV